MPSSNLGNNKSNTACIILLVLGLHNLKTEEEEECEFSLEGKIKSKRSQNDLLF